MFEVCHCNLWAGGGYYEKSNRCRWGEWAAQGVGGGLKRWAGVGKSLGSLHMWDSSSVIHSKEQSEDVILLIHYGKKE